MAQGERRQVSYRVLVLEDDTELRETLAELLEEEGYQVVAVGRGEEAVRQAASQPFDLIVSDIRMDGMDGLEAIDRSRKLQPGLGSLVVSGYASEKETLRAIHLNVGGYLRKPFSMKEFLQSVQTVLAKQTQQLRHQREVEGYRTAFGWAMKTLTELCDEVSFPRPEGGLARLSHLGEAMAHRLGLGPQVAQQVGWATVVAILSGQGNSSGLVASLSQLSKTSAFVAGLLDLAQGEVASLERRIVTLSLHLWKLGEIPAASELPAGLLEQGLGPVYQSVRQQVLDQGGRALDLDILRALSDSVQRQRSLLALAGALEESQDDAAAAHAYREVVESKPGQTDLGLTQALLGLARLAKKQGQPEAVSDWIHRVQDGCRSLSASAASQALLEAGLLLADGQPQRAVQLLQQAEALAGQAGRPLASVKARFALLRLGVSVPGGDFQADARTLLEPAAKGEFAESWRWLLPALLEHIENPGERTLFRLILDFSQELCELLKGGGLTPKARHAVLDCLESQEYEVPAELSEALLSDQQSDIRQRALQLRNRSHRDQPTVSLRIQSFGFFQVVCGSRKVPESDWRTQKIKYLLAYLAAAAGRRVSEDELLEEFWPETRGPSKRNLYVATTELRRVLRPNPQAKEIDYIVRERGALFLNLQLPVWHDASDCELAAEKAAAAEKQGDQEGSLTHYRKVATLCTGPYLEGCYQEWAVRRRSSWDERALRAYTALAQHALAHKQPQEALDFSSRALEVDPGSQQGHLFKLRSHLQLRQPEAVIRHFEATEKLLRKEYELEPTIEMVEVYTRARHGMFD